MTVCQLEIKMKKFAKDIRDKYIEVPYTTDFGIMFLPTEGLFFEVIHINGFLESVMMDYKVEQGLLRFSAFLRAVLAWELALARLP